MKVLVIGGTGWLGHNIVKQLKAEDVDVTILSRGKFKTYSDDIDGNIPVITADKTDESAMKAVLETRYTHIIDTVPRSSTISYIIKYAKNLHHYIHCSSTGGYTPLPFIPCDETAQYGGFRGQSGWDQKRIVDEQVMDAFMKEGFPATVIRPCYITGAGMLPLDNLGDRRQDFIKDILEEKVLDMFNDGQALLQPIHIKDLAHSFLLAMSHVRSKGQIYNICLDHALPFNRYVELNGAAFGKAVHFNYMPVEAMLEKYKGNICEIGLRFAACHMCFTIEKARRDLEYIPKYTPEEAIQEAAIWAAQTQGLI